MRSPLRTARWAGPSPLLLAATVLAFVVAPIVSGTGSVSAADAPPDPRTPVAQVQEPEVTRSHERLPTRGGQLIQRRDVIGVATMNQFSRLTDSQAWSDAVALTSQPDVDVVGWQESQHFAKVLAGLRNRGWESRRFPNGARELAVSWRSSKFSYVKSTSRMVAEGIDGVSGRYPFSNRFIVRVTLKHKATGRLLSVINTHLPQKSEDLGNPGHWDDTYNAAKARTQLQALRQEWRRTPGRWVVGTGDYNFDFRADVRAKLPSAPFRALGQVARSSYDVLGGRDVRQTHPPTGRRIDYVFAARSGLRSGAIKFLGQRTLPGLNSDHLPLLVRLALRS